MKPLNNFSDEFENDIEISENERLKIIARIPALYLRKHHEQDSLTTIGFLFLADKLLEDSQANRDEDERGFLRDDFWKLVGNRYREIRGGEPNQESLKAVAGAIATQLNKFMPVVDHGRKRLVLHLNGPTRAQRGDEGPADRYYLVLHIEDVTSTTFALSHLIGRCFLCGSMSDFDPNDRFCVDNPACFGNRFPPIERLNYITILPERRLDEGAPLPNRLQLESELVRFAPEVEVREERDLESLPFLPFKQDYLRELGLALGTPLVYETPHLAAWSGFRKVLVLDMSPYTFTSTLKDPKSWAVINDALEMNATHLVVYTAGNAGLSIAKIVYQVNRLTGRRIQVLAMTGDDVSDNVRSLLSACGCKVLRLPTASGAFPIADKREVWRLVHSHIDGSSSEDPIAGVVDASDGWDGHGIAMYRSIFARMLRRISPNYLVLPAGTGNLLLGASLALSDSSPGSTLTRLVAAVPYPDNIMQACLEEKMPYDRRFRVVTEDDAMMPKLSGAYSPLIPCVSYLLSKKRVQFIQVSRTMQFNAARWMATLDAGVRVHAEPSALAGFAALVGSRTFRRLRDYAKEKEVPSEYRTVPVLNSTVLVVNTGCGALGEQDYAFLAATGLN